MTTAWAKRVRVSQRSVVLDWLAAGVPLSLLYDLAQAEGPDSADILRTEANSLAS